MAKKISNNESEATIARVKMNEFATGSYGVYHKDLIYSVPEQMGYEIATLFVANNLAKEI